MVNYDINYKSDNNTIVLWQWELQTVIIKKYIFCDKKKALLTNLYNIVRKLRFFAFIENIL